MTTFNNLTISNSAGVSLGATATVNGTLTLSLGLLITGANQIDVAAAAVVVGGSSTSYVNGSLQKAFANAGNQSFTFPIGDASTFTPLALSAFNVTSAGTLVARTAAGEHPNLQTSGINPAQDVNRYWTLSPQPGLGMSSCTATFTFVPADVDAGASTTNFIAKRFGGSWSATTVATAAATSTTMTGLCRRHGRTAGAYFDLMFAAARRVRLDRIGGGRRLDLQDSGLDGPGSVDGVGRCNGWDQWSLRVPRSERFRFPVPLLSRRSAVTFFRNPAAGKTGPRDHQDHWTTRPRDHGQFFLNDWQTRRT
jgi:hypothetical protein